MLKKIDNPSNFLNGKTIKKVDCTADNVHLLFFEDNTAAAVEIENFGGAFPKVSWNEFDPNEEYFKQ